MTPRTTLLPPRDTLPSRPRPAPPPSTKLIHSSKCFGDSYHHACANESEADEYVKLGGGEKGWHDGDAQDARIRVIFPVDSQRILRIRKYIPAEQEHACHHVV